MTLRRSSHSRSRASGRGLPGWFEVHPSYTHDEALAELRAIDAGLSQQGLSQPLVIGETAYNDARVAQAIATFEASVTRANIDSPEKNPPSATP